MVHAPLKRMCILVFLDVMSCRYQLNPTGLLCHLESLLPYWFHLEYLSIDVSRVLKSLTITVFLSVSPSMSVHICFIYLGASILGEYVNECNIIFLYWSLYHYIVSFFVFPYGLCFSLSCLIWILLPPLSCCFHLHEVPFSIPSLSIYVCLCPKVSLL